MNALDAAFWERRYATGDTPWDLAGPTPVFLDLIAQGHLTPCRLLIPGAGRGHDALAFARAGFQVTALDVAAAPCEALRRAAAQAEVDLEVRQADFFTLTERYEAVVEYTFFCALAPALHAAFFRQMAQVVEPGGRLAALAFPLGPRDDRQGPPFAMQLESLKAGLTPAFDLLHEGEHPATIHPRRGREILTLWRRRRAP